MKIYAVFLIILLIVLQFKFWFEEGGYFYNLGLKEELAVVKQENASLKTRNQELARQIILVKEDMNEVEALARRNLGMIKKDEQFMFIIEDEATTKADTGSTSSLKPDADHHE